MERTTVGNDPVDTRFMIERLVSTLSEIHEVLEGYYDQVPRYVFDLIEKMLDDYEDRYGKNAPRGSGRE